MSHNSESRVDANSVCYRHPNRHSYVLCQRCGRTICGECQTPAAVGVVCPECLREQRANRTPSQKRAQSWAARGAATGIFSSVTNVLIVVTVFVFILQLVFRPQVTEALQYAGLYSTPYMFEPWRMITSIFTHSTSFFLHVFLNMYTLWIFGRALEQMLGRWLFLTLYLASGLAGSLAVMFLSDPRVPVVGASGAIFGVMAAFVVIQRRMGNQMRSLLVLLALNLAIGFIPGTSIAWQAHLGGVIGGALIGLIVFENRAVNQRRRLWTWLIALCTILVLLSFTWLVFPPF